MEELEYYTKLCARTQGVKDDLALHAAEYQIKDEVEQSHGFLKSSLAGLGWLVKSVVHLFSLKRLHSAHHYPK
jgi:hypothetical protein